MKAKNTVSVIVPVYNVKVYIRDCVDSILYQSVPFDEIILVNDGSTDGSEIVCREYKFAHPEITLIEQKNLGLSEARNSGMRKATGDYIIFVDADDWVSNTACETIKRKIADQDLDVLFYAADIVKEIPMKVSDQIYYRDLTEVNKVMTGFESLKKMFPSYYEMSACMAAYSRNFLERQNIDFIKNILYEDRYFSLQVITEAQKVMYIADKLYIRRFRASSIITSPASKRKIRDVMQGHKKEWAYIRNRDEWKKEQSLMRYFALCGAMMAYQSDVSSQETPEDRIEYLHAFFKEWLSCFVLEDMTDNELCQLLLLVKQVTGSGRTELTDLFEKNGGLDVYQARIRELLFEKCRNRLRELPFGTRKCVGIYGAGAHTECLLRLYQNIIGTIEADVFLLVSDNKNVKQDGELVMKSLDDSLEEADVYILSSKIYQNDMYSNLRRRLVPEEKIQRLYEKTDAVDCVMLYEALYT